MNLPTPDKKGLDRSKRITNLIQKKIIANKNWISFDHFMEIALYSPLNGYYCSSSYIFGNKGDFITAPELTPFFARAFCNQIVEVLESGFDNIYEIGGGTGKAALDIMTELNHRGCLPKKYYILEISRELEFRQKKLLKDKIPHLFSKFFWIKNIPESFEGILFANELLDAIPFKIVDFQEDGLFEKGLSLDKKKLVWSRKKISATLQEKILKIDVKHPYQTELGLLSLKLVETIAKSLQKGLIFFFDYGFNDKEFYHPQRKEGTLMCHYKNFAHTDPLFFPGLQDITSHVNFSMIADTGYLNGLNIVGYTNMAQFLINCDIVKLLDANFKTSKKLDWYKTSSDVGKLISPSEMGELFKVLCFSKDFNSQLLGFKENNFLGKL